VIVYTGGTFDMLHVGHLELLRELRRVVGHSGSLIASVNRDEFVERYKGRRPIQSLSERIEIVRACRFVDAAVVNIGDEDSRVAIEVVSPDVIGIGTDWLDPNYDERRYHAQLGVTPLWLSDRGIRIEYISRTRGRSSTAMRQELA
jgi:glycerol-3-phosphate cytidylyltransferase